MMEEYPALQYDQVNEKDKIVLLSRKKEDQPNNKVPPQTLLYKLPNLTIFFYRQCKQKITSCGNSNLRWVGTGCKAPDGSRLLDGGCQCEGYCGFGCESACEFLFTLQC
jgi:hypothetical protein